MKKEREKPSNDELVANATNLSELLQYQKKAVVSRTIIDKKAGTVTLFAFDEDQGLSEHTAPFDAWVYVLDGEVEITIAGAPVRLEMGEMTVLPAGKPHALKALTRFKMLLVMVRG